ncbi:acyltransferase [Chishuiella changwenlii]|uniref:acyltransferase n=1 Tax=Chishuiella changwenlii TaxID=1434701 RepID=UPI002FDB1710
MNKRFNNIDILKSLAIYLVIIYHFNRIDINIIQPKNDLIYINLFLKSFFSVCVPIFFFVNGFLLLNKDKIDLKKHINKIIKIIILSLFWGVVTLVSLMFIRGEFLSLQETIKSIWFLKVWWNAHLWFLFDLIVIYIFYPLIHTCFKSDKKVFYFFFVCVMLFTFGNVLLGNIATVISYVTNRFSNIDFQVNYFSSINPFRGIPGYSIGYFILGGIIGKEFSPFLDRNKRKFTIIAIFALPIFTFCLSLYTIIVSLRSKQMWDVVWNGYSNIFTLLNVISLYIISISFKSNNYFGKFIRIVSDNSLGIYFIHVIVGDFLMLYYDNLEYSNIFFINIIFAFIILLISLLLTVILSKTPVVKYFTYI